MGLLMCSQNTSRLHRPPLVRCTITTTLTPMRAATWTSVGIEGQRLPSCRLPRLDPWRHPLSPLRPPSRTPTTSTRPASPLRPWLLLALQRAVRRPRHRASGSPPPPQACRNSSRMRPRSRLWTRITWTATRLRTTRRAPSYDRFWTAGLPLPRQPQADVSAAARRHPNLSLQSYAHHSPAQTRRLPYELHPILVLQHLTFSFSLLVGY